MNVLVSLCVMAKVWHVTKAWACWEWRRKAGKLPLSRDVGRKMASRNNDAYIYEIYAWHPLEFDDLSLPVCVQYMCETLISRLPSWEGLLRFFLILIFNLNKRKVFFVCASRGIFIAVRGVAAGGRKHTTNKVSGKLVVTWAQQNGIIYLGASLPGIIIDAGGRKTFALSAHNFVRTPLLLLPLYTPLNEIKIS